MASDRELGIRQLDRLLAPIPPGARIAFVNDPGVEAEPFLYQSAQSRLEDGGEVVYAVTNRAPQAALAAMTEYGLSSEGLASGRLRFLDAFSGLMGSEASARYRVRDPTDLASFAATLERAADDSPDALLCIDSLSTLLDTTTPERFADALPRLLAAMQRFRASASLFTRWPYGLDIDMLLAGFDAQVALRGVQDRVVFRQYFSVERANWVRALDAKPRLYKAVRPGGVVVYIPKILVTGPADAGKSTFVHAASDQSASADHGGTTVAMDHGHVTLDGLTADLFGTPGQSRFDPLLKTLASQALGVVVVVDATQPASFARAREMMRLVGSEGLPAVIAANKQDLPGALPPAKVARLLGAPDHVRVVGCVAAERGSAQGVLRGLMDQILERSVPA